MKLTKKIFGENADRIRRKANEIKFDDSFQAKKVCDETKAFITEHKGNVNFFLIEGVERAELSFSEMKDTKDGDEKSKFWRKGVSDLIYVLQTIKYENSYAD